MNQMTRSHNTTPILQFVTRTLRLEAQETNQEAPGRA